MTDERTLTCQELTEVLTDYLEGVMPPEDVARFEAHLEVCDGCVTYVDQMRQTIRTVRALRAEDVEATAPDDLLAAFRAWKRGEPVPGT
jgi:predicted anti-sigma-YlaC factor YlaD